MRAISAVTFYVIEEKYKLFTWYIILPYKNDSGETVNHNYILY